MKIDEAKILGALYDYFRENKNGTAIDYDYFLNVYLPMSLNIKSVSSIEELKKKIETNKIGQMIKYMCDASVNNNAKQNGIQFINRFGEQTKNEIIINIIDDDNKGTNQ